MLGSRQVILVPGNDPASTAINQRPLMQQLMRRFQSQSQIFHRKSEWCAINERAKPRFLLIAKCFCYGRVADLDD
jgi:hypothetical protein